MPPSIGETDGPDPAGLKGDENVKVWREDLPLAREVDKFYPSKRPLRNTTDEPLTMANIAKHNKRDDLWIIVDGKCYDVTKFVEHHPGGWLPMVNMGGKDCTDVFANYHPQRVYEKMLPSYFLGDVVDYTESPFVRGHRAIRQRLLREGRFTTRMSFYYYTAAWISSIFAGALYLTLACTSFTAHMGGAVLLALFWQQMAFVGHDIGHIGITHDYKTDNRNGIVIGNLLTGISIGWWKRSHNVHHIVCNSIEHDPDIQHMPVFAVNKGVFGRWWSTYHEKWVETDAVARFLVSKQHYLFYPIMAVARFNLYIQGWLHVLVLWDKSANRYQKREGRLAEIVSLSAFAVWLTSLVAYMPVQHGAWERTAYVLLSHALAGCLHVQICLSHFHMGHYHGHAYNNDSDEWFRMQLATTLNIDCPKWLDWFHGGLQFQIEHHLWPRLPRHELRYASELVRAYCKEQKVHYHYPGWIEAQKELVAHLKQVATDAGDLKRGDGGFYESTLWDGLNAQG